MENFPGEKIDNWFYYQDGSIRGPIDINGLVQLNHEEPHDKPILASKRGLRKWYKISDVERLIEVDQKYKLEIDQEKQKLRDLLQEKIVILQHLGASPESAPSMLEPQNLGSLTEPLPSSAALPDPTDKPGSLEKSLTEATLSGVFLRQKPPKAATLPQRKSISPYNFEATDHIGDSYHYLKGRLRLGSRLNPYWGGLILCPLSLGGFWYFWVKRAILELLWHLTNDFEWKEVKLPVWLALVPGIHLWFVFFIANTIKKMEQQNGYQNTSLLIAMILGILPPLAIVYLQGAMNLHWRGHVNNHEASRLRFRAKD